MIPELLKSIAGSTTRWALTFVGAWLIRKGILSEADFNSLVAGAGLGLATLAWSYWAKYKERIIRLLALDAPAGTSEAEILVKAQKGTSSVSVWSIALLLTVTGMASTLSGCGKKTTTEKLAVFTATGATSFDAMAKAIDALQASGKIAPEKAKAVYLVILKTNGALDIVRDRAQSGYDKQEVLTILDAIIADLRRAEADGVVGLNGSDKDRFLAITFFAQFSIRSIQSVILAAKPPVLPEAQVSRALARDGSVWTELVLILQNAVIKGINQYRMTAAEAFADGVTTSEALRAFLNAKIAG